jgi:hypothetical protein
MDRQCATLHRSIIAIDFSDVDVSTLFAIIRQHIHSTETTNISYNVNIGQYVSRFSRFT